MILCVSPGFRSFRSRSDTVFAHSDDVCISLNPGCKESAFLYAITAAGVAHTITGACSSGNFASCGCDRSLSGRPSGNWEWRGCHSNVKFAGALTKEFALARVSKTGNEERKKMNRHNIRAGVKVIFLRILGIYSRNNCMLVE